MSDLFSIHTVFFTLWGYPMSYLEFFGTILNLWSVWLVAKNNILTWPVGIVGVILFGILFYQIRLYSDLIEQIYFLITGFYGWGVWYLARDRPSGQTSSIRITYNSMNSNRYYIVVIATGSLAMGYVTSHVHEYFPQWFPEPASYPYLDAFTTVMSFAATILMAHKKIECWYLWICVDVIGIGLYYAKGVVFVSMLYAIFLVLAMKGLFNWRHICAIDGVEPAIIESYREAA